MYTRCVYAYIRIYIYIYIYMNIHMHNIAWWTTIYLSHQPDRVKTLGLGSSKLSDFKSNESAWVQTGLECSKKTVGWWQTRVALCLSIPLIYDGSCGNPRRAGRDGRFNSSPQNDKQSIRRWLVAVSYMLFCSIESSIVSRVLSTWHDDHWRHLMLRSCLCRRALHQ